MFERFTEKAVNVVYEAQNFAKEMKSAEVFPEHLLLALVCSAKGVSLKIFRMFGMSDENVCLTIAEYLPQTKNAVLNIPFSNAVKDILKKTLDLASKSENSNILFEHLFLSVINDKNSNIQNILNKFNFDKIYAEDLLTKLVQKKIKKLEHPETEDDVSKNNNPEAIYDGVALADVLDRAVSKLSAYGYEILGTEQILESVLESEESPLTEIIKSNGITHDAFEKQLKTISSRRSEFEDKKIVFTPNAFYVMNMALQIAKEMGSSEVMPEHVVLSILKTKKGLAYKIVKSLNINENKLIDEIMKPIEKQMSETNSILKLAKEEARRIGRNVVGTEMFLLGILGEGASVAAEVLNNLEVNMKDARVEVENLIGYGNEYFDKEISFTKRAKQVLENAWLRAKKVGKQKIEATDLLLAIIDEPGSVAMKVLTNLGVDAVEIKVGINEKTINM